VSQQVRYAIKIDNHTIKTNGNMVLARTYNTSRKCTNASAVAAGTGSNAAGVDSLRAAGGGGCGANGGMLPLSRQWGVTLGSTITGWYGR